MKTKENKFTLAEEVQEGFLDQTHSNSIIPINYEDDDDDMEEFIDTVCEELFNRA